LLLAALGLAACASVGPNYERPDVTLPQAWSSPAPVTRAAGDELGAWWARFNDPLLGALVSRAQAASPDLQIAAARLRQARARRTATAAARYPTLGASATAQRSRTEGQAGGAQLRSSYGAGLDAAWEADIFGGVRRGVEAADADLASAEEALHDAQVSLAAELAMTYVDVRTLQARLRIAAASLASQTETVALTAWRAQAGLVNEQDLLQAQSNLEQTRAQVPALAQALTEAEHTLDALVGQTPGALHAALGAYAAFPSASTQIAVGVPADLLRRRPDVRAAERRLAAETARLGVATAALYPSFRLSGSIGLEALTLASLGDGGSLTSSLLGGITAPLFQGRRLRAEVEAQDAAREQALAGYRQAVLAALQDVENALAAVARTQERLAALDRAAASARAAAQLARQRYGAGLIDFQSVLTTERTLLTIDDSLATTRADGTLSLIRLYKALGGGWTNEAKP
jgi:NodT family efflux transporter outer membrane factor (OMF) lipoprotein